MNEMRQQVIEVCIYAVNSEGERESKGNVRGRCKHSNCVRGARSAKGGKATAAAGKKIDTNVPSEGEGDNHV